MTATVDGRQSADALTDIVLLKTEVLSHICRTADAPRWTDATKVSNGDFPSMRNRGILAHFRKLILH